jgi:hypothetical protein
MVPRRDGLMLQTNRPTDFNNTDIVPDRAEADRAVQIMADLMGQMR